MKVYCRVENGNIVEIVESNLMLEAPEYFVEAPEELLDPYKTVTYVEGEFVIADRVFPIPVNELEKIQIELAEARQLINAMLGVTE